ncbi:hypothetical protein BAUCODRAFT_38860 [Baudoinia panamericana UAMH 10762]|uniref:Uncharacterized protein n=1 Tax=Baudoinia panamericana (strain UAMH 10762) TaxID=717646 RepID=M2MZG6_BAUPA|nr:uncharacterized protein BAUCODRAFT_38860 [Baudoinia panamericana UAMH 10762]EMC91730.1 hypothetical protein BAUCODRAFT_38860 [Baudoinia panamericana UAMH 10762]
MLNILLVEASSHPSTKHGEEYGRAPFGLAAWNRREAVVKQLPHTGKAEGHGQHTGDRTPFSWAVDNGDEAVVKLISDSL